MGCPVLDAYILDSYPLLDVYRPHIGRMKRMDIRQAWHEKLALNICACVVFVIVVLGVVICPAEHVYNTAELASHSSTLSPYNVLTSIRGEVLDLTSVAETQSAGGGCRACQVDFEIWWPVF